MLFGRRGHPHFGPFHLLSTAFIGGGFWLLAAAWRVLYEVAGEVNDGQEFSAYVCESDDPGLGARHRC